MKLNLVSAMNKVHEYVFLKEKDSMFEGGVCCVHMCWFIYMAHHLDFCSVSQLSLSPLVDESRRDVRVQISRIISLAGPNLS